MRLRRLMIVPGAAALTLAGMALAAKEGPAGGVQVERVGRHGLVATAIGNGQLRPAQRADVESETGGRVTHLFVHEGSAVKPGDPLAEVDRTHAQMAMSKALATLGQARAAAAQVRANLLQSQAGLRRAEGIAAGSGLLAAADLEQARTSANGLAASYESAQSGVRAAEAAAGDARDALEKTTIVAPIGGTVTRLRVRVGETLGGGASPNATVATIADLSTLQAVVNVSETDLPRVHVGDSASLKVEAFARTSLAGYVMRIGAASLGGTTARQSALYEVIIRLAPTTRTLYPDLSITAEIVTDRRSGVLGVPLMAVVMRDYNGRITAKERVKEKGKVFSRRTAVEGVFVVRDGRARFRAVRTGIIGDQYVEILKGLAEGERVIVGPYQFLRDIETGAEVEVVEADGNSAVDDAERR
jgi:HlyD family secretion protein